MNKINDESSSRLTGRRASPLFRKLAPSHSKVKVGFTQVVAVFGIATLLGLFFADKGYLLSRDNFGTTMVAKAVWWNVVDWYGWAALVPAIFWSCRRLADHRPRLVFIAGHIGAGLAFAFAHCAILTTAAWIETGKPWLNLWSHYIVLNHAYDDVVTYCVIVCAWVAIAYYGKFKQRELASAQLESQLTRAELHALKMQLNPHFLFNTLNGIASLNYDDPRTANRMLAKLSDLLRITFADEPAQETTLGKELDFNRQYLELEQMRLGDRLSIKWDIPAETLDARVPTLILQPLIENAVRHGIAPFAREGRVWVNSRIEDGMLEIEVGDSGPGFSGVGEKSERPGIGLKNTRLRLQKMYGDRHKFETEDQARSRFIVRISIPFERETSHAVSQGSNLAESCDEPGVLS